MSEEEAVETPGIPEVQPEQASAPTSDNTGAQTDIEEDGQEHTNTPDRPPDEGEPPADTKARFMPMHNGANGPSLTQWLEDVGVDPKLIEEAKAAREMMCEDRLDRLYCCERIIDKGLKGALSAAYALTTIRDEGLYQLKQYQTFEDYLVREWGFSKSRGYQLIDAFRVVENIHTCGPDLHPPENEAQVRPLVQLEPQEQVAVWQGALQEAGHGRVTARLVQKVKDRRDRERKAAAGPYFQRLNPHTEIPAYRWSILDGDRMDSSLQAPQKTELPAKPDARSRWVAPQCAGMDPYDPRAPRYLTDAFHSTAEKSQQWTYLALSDTLGESAGFDGIPINVWLGAPIRSSVGAAEAAQVFAAVREKHPDNRLFAHCELHGSPITLGQVVAPIDWLIIAPGPDEQGKAVTPDWDHVAALVAEAHTAEVEVFFHPGLNIALNEVPA
ncbi:MAG: hypothetical protein HN742_35400 [Lentisphaerae bacterium]|jgi:hypothetical protein|nr:hypothetical protein [Lentisphaerota bacterium]MBT4818815.1 hypothetical protein [Lentisphaerota bacterium]MBT5604649.1 hypothetical protein [Lentisphaerota bacterium]MBT7057437.1 hypothetical protein [Lentisphaerota bacterium]MBT7847210.1 hypothetical protein [Lentisphaerota bacterium]